MKIGRGLISKPQSLWVQVMRGKYRCGMGSLPVVKHKRFESEAWKGIRRTWDSVVEGTRWRIRNENTVKFWKGKWLAVGVEIQQISCVPVPDEVLNITVGVCVAPAIGWKSSLF